ncbi:MAG TPA: DUF5683 domain-containing protein [Cytophagales bacterium]|nr:DUF5683 domain-containing protein [Cytophagales bacterium]
MRLFYCIYLFCLISLIPLFEVQGQDTLSYRIDTIKIKEISPRSNKYFDPDRAAILSAVVPGLGQIYNRRLLYIKLPVIYGGIGALYYFFDLNNNRFRSYRNAKINLQNPEANLSVDPEIQQDVERALTRSPRTTVVGQLERLESNYRRNRDLTIILACASYGLIVAEAYVDAHLKGFKISRDLSFKPKPSIERTAFSTPAIGLGFKLSLSDK